MLASKARTLIDRCSRLVLAAAVGLILCAPLAAQCAMCKETASYQRQEAIEALNRGIIVLAIPPASIIVGMVCLTYRYRGGAEDPREPDSFGDDE
jgi:hypothetical protein